MDSLTSASASELAAAIRAREVSSTEAIDAHLARIEAVNPRLNAVVQLDAEGARATARARDEALARGETPGPLHGVPFTVKDWIETEGLVCAAGQKERALLIPKRDATAVARLRAAGGVLLGKTLDGVDGARNAVYGVCHNPYDLARTPGESSSGEAAIVAAGGSPLGLASDSGGSIRYPAHCCGVAALKPSAGRVPLTGHFPRIDWLNDPRTQIGPIARRVEDIALALAVIGGPDGRDASVAPVPLEDWTAVDLPRLRVAMFTAFGRASPDASTVEAVRSAARALADAGAEVEETLPPRLDDVWDITLVHWARVRSYSWREWRAEKESSLTADEIERSLFAWGRLQREMLAFMARYDAVLIPAAPSAAAVRADNPGPGPFVYTLPWSLTGYPVAVVRAGTSSDRMPVGVQLVAGPWRDDVALAAAAQVERALGGWQAPELR